MARKSRPAIEVNRIDHVVLLVADLERSVRFYAEVLGMHEERRLDEFGMVQMRAGASLVDLQQAKKTGRRGWRGGHNMHHVAFNLAHFNEKKLRAHLKAHGISAGEVRPRYGADGRGKTLDLIDPDGNLIELKGPSTAHERRKVGIRKRAASAANATGAKRRTRRRPAGG